MWLVGIMLDRLFYNQPGRLVKLMKIINQNQKQEKNSI